MGGGKDLDNKARTLGMMIFDLKEAVVTKPSLACPSWYEPKQPKLDWFLSEKINDARERRIDGPVPISLFFWIEDSTVFEWNEIIELRRE
jgi:hypothetical protein